MERRQFLHLFAVSATGLAGCRGKQVAHVLEPDAPDMVGSHSAGAETWKPLVHQAVGQLLGRHSSPVVTVSAEDSFPVPGATRRICFVGVENRTSEEIGDFKEQIYEHINATISSAELYAPVSRRFIDAGLRQTRLRPDELFIPGNRRTFAAVMEQLDSGFDFLLYAKLTSGTTQNNSSYQRDYMLTLEMVDVHSGQSDTESAVLRKGYHTSRVGKLLNYGRG